MDKLIKSDHPCLDPSPHQKESDKKLSRDASSLEVYEAKSLFMIAQSQLFDNPALRVKIVDSLDDVLQHKVTAKNEATIIPDWSVEACRILCKGECDEDCMIKSAFEFLQTFNERKSAVQVAASPTVNGDIQEDSRGPGTSVASTSRGAMPKQVKSDVKPRGRMTAYAFFVQICREEHKKKHPDEHVVFAEFSKKCAERWKSMSDKEKKRFHELADKDKQRYETEMKDYTPSENDKRRGKKRKMKDPNAPKRPLTAFFLFSNVERSKVKEINPEYTAGDTSKELGRRWSEADPSVKSKYQELADKDKARYDREMSEYKLKGKFTSAAQRAKEEEEAELDEEEDEDDDVE